MKKYILTFVMAFTLLLTSVSFGMEISDDLTFSDFEKSLKREFLQDGSKFTFNLSISPKEKLTILGDLNKEANVFISENCFLLKTDIDKLLPKLKENAEIKNAPCADLMVVEDMGVINADDIDFIMKEIVGMAYVSMYMDDIFDRDLKGIARKSVFAIIFDDKFLNGEQADFFMAECGKVYEEIKDKNLLPEHLVLNFVFKLFENCKEKKLYYKAEYLRLLKAYKAKHSFNANDKTFYQLLRTDDAQIKYELKDFVSSNFKNSSSIAILPIWFSMANAFSTKKNVSEYDYRLVRELIGGLLKSETFAKENENSLFLKRVLIEVDLLSENPNYDDIKNRLQANKETVFEWLKLAYVLEKLGGKENLEKSRDFIAKFKNENDGIPSLFLLDVVFNKDYAKFMLKSFGILNYVDFLANTSAGKECFEEIKKDKSFNLSKEDLMKIKMHTYISDIEACEIQEDFEDRKLAFKILKSYLENDKTCRNIGFLQYVLFCMCEGRNTGKDIEGAKKNLGRIY